MCRRLPAKSRRLQRQKQIIEVDEIAAKGLMERHKRLAKKEGQMDKEWEQQVEEQEVS